MLYKKIIVQLQFNIPKYMKNSRVFLTSSHFRTVSVVDSKFLLSLKNIMWVLSNVGAL